MFWTKIRLCFIRFHSKSGRLFTLLSMCQQHSLLVRVSVSDRVRLESQVVQLSHVREGQMRSLLHGVRHDLKRAHLLVSVTSVTAVNGSWQWRLKQALSINRAVIYSSLFFKFACFIYYSKKKKLFLFICLINIKYSCEAFFSI